MDADFVLRFPLSLTFPKATDEETGHIREILLKNVEPPVPRKMYSAASTIKRRYLMYTHTTKNFFYKR